VVEKRGARGEGEAAYVGGDGSGVDYVRKAVHDRNSRHYVNGRSQYRRHVTLYVNTRAKRGNEGQESRNITLDVSQGRGTPKNTFELKLRTPFLSFSEKQ
jgi:hypothetical protein